MEASGIASKIDPLPPSLVSTPEELTAYRHGGILPYVLRRLAGK